MTTFVTAYCNLCHTEHKEVFKDKRQLQCGSVDFILHDFYTEFTCIQCNESHKARTKSELYDVLTYIDMMSPNFLDNFCNEHEYLRCARTTQGEWSEYIISGKSWRGNGPKFVDDGIHKIPQTKNDCLCEKCIKEYERLGILDIGSILRLLREN